MFTKFSPGLFLEKVELERFAKSLDANGFRLFLLNSTFKAGLIKKQYFNDNNIVQNTFNNGKVYESSGLTISHNEINAIDINGNFIYKKAETNIPVPADNNWYWVKIKHTYTSKELGLFSIDQNGNLTGDSNSELLTILRGQPYFPTRVRFLNSVHNTIEYDVLEVIDDSNAILQGYFNPETNLQLSIVGTFAPDVTPSANEKDIFQYDDCELTLIQESTANTEPPKIDGEEFFLARVRNDGVDLFIQDKRTEVWQVKSDFLSKNIDKTTNALFGVERVRYDHTNSTKDENIVDIAWCMRSENWSVNSKLNQVTLSAGQGGRFKDVNYFTDGDFDSWRLYWPDGSYSNILSSVKSGSQINLTLDSLDIDKVSNDGGNTFINTELLVTPNAEEIEITLESYNTGAAAPGPEIVNKKVTFPINQPKALIKLLVFQDQEEYSIKYRYKKDGEYSAFFNMILDNQFGYYTEKAFDSDGEILPLVQSQSYSVNLAGGYIALYLSNRIKLSLKSDAYINTINSIDLGDALGVESRSINDTPNDITLTVGTSKVYQYFVGVSSPTATYTLNDNKRIILANGTRNGNYFILHFKQNYDLNGKTFRIVDAAFNTLKSFTQNDIDFINTSPEGMYIRCTWDGTKWILNSTNEVSYPAIYGNTYTSLTTISQLPTTLIASHVPFQNKSGKVLINFNAHITPGSGVGSVSYTISFKILRNGLEVKEMVYTVENNGAHHNITLQKYLTDYTAGDTISITAITNINASVSVFNADYSIQIYQN